LFARSATLQLVKQHDESIPPFFDASDFEYGYSLWIWYFFAYGLRVHLVVSEPKLLGNVDMSDHASQNIFGFSLQLSRRF